MITVRLRFLGGFRSHAGVSTDVVIVPDGADLKAVLGVLVQKYGTSFQETLWDSEGRLRTHCKLFLNGHSLPSGETFDERTKVQDEDELDMFYLVPVMGG